MTNKIPALNKDVCKHCMSISNVTTGPKEVLCNHSEWIKPPMPWTDKDIPYNHRVINSDIKEKICDELIESDESKWNRGIVTCPEWGSNQSIYVIPKNCPYKMEHIILNRV